jgi:peptidyl-prolyl cis-trans isomerase C
VISVALVALVTSSCSYPGVQTAPLARQVRVSAAPQSAAAAEPGKAVPAQAVPAVLPDVVARVNGETVTKTELEAAIGALERRNQGPVPPDQRDQIYRGVLDQLVGFKLLSQEAAAQKVVVPDAEVDAQLAQIRQQFPTEEAFNQALAQQQKTVDGLKADARGTIAIQKMLETSLAGKVAVTPAQSQEFYDKNPDQFKQPEQVRASHILISVPASADAPTKAAAQQKAEALLKQLKSGGDFAALAKENSQDPGSAVNGGDLGFFGRGQMVGPFDEAAFTLATGATSELVETQFGYHIIRVAEKKAAGLIALDTVRTEVEQYLLGQNQQREMKVFVDALKAKGKIEILI